MSFYVWLLSKVANLPHRTIYNCERDPYLTRFVLLHTRRLGVMLHYFHRSDEDRAFHDHPWNFISILLWRGYIEHTAKGSSRKWPGMILFRRAEWAHRVELIGKKPAISLVIRFKRRREWGYHYPGVWVHWEAWWSQNCE